ncbi:MAG: glycosyltransferase [Lachnospiraceae bacterium]|nr:glycosyltransferase [Lachnospiraceae bacterium]
MKKIFERIKYSEFYKKYLKELKFTMLLRKIRDVLVRIKKSVKEWIEQKGKAPDILGVLEQYVTLDGATTQPSDTLIDVIVPIYNGYDYLVHLFQDLPKTKMNCRFILVDDKSPDERVRELERVFVANHDNAVLLENEKNYGFVKTVNNGLEISTGHVALVNTDTELPEGWLERLMEPILKDETIGSTTPFTNSGTIFSFPNFCYNNRIYLGKSVDEIDSFFQKIRPRYVEAPTGVGFCMGMNRKAIDKIGVLDYETFERGFGEENDWCQRAKSCGFKNVYVENLFVYHRHGGSFVSQEKQQLITEHLQRLSKKFPYYNAQVQQFIEDDPNKKVRHIVQMLIDSHEKESVLYFDHSLGGGATSYMDMQINQLLGRGVSVFVVRYLTPENRYEFNFYGDKEEKHTYSFSRMDEILEIGKYLHFGTIYINELVTYPNLWEVQKTILTLKEQHGSDLIMLFHDYFAICPSINLLDKDNTFCEDACGEVCEACYERNGYKATFQCDTRQQWLSNWNAFLSQCTEVRCFSQDTLDRVQKVYGQGLALTLVPHRVNYAFPIYKDHKTTDTLNIGLLGVLAPHKGGEVVRQLLEEIENQKLNISVRLIGWSFGVPLDKYSCYSETGKYKAEDLPKLVYENDIDIFMITSIWPETFSYTAQEIIHMGMPIAVYDLGAPAERVRNYDKGLILDRHAKPQEVLSQVQEFMNQYMQSGDYRKVSFKRNIYVTEYSSFSSRYRLEHLKEELLYHGMDGDLYEAKKIPKTIPWEQVGAVFIYRCQYQKNIIKLMQQAKAHNVPVIYDVDDLVFDVSQLDYEFEVDKNVYGDFEQYSRRVSRCMDEADKIMVSTDNMKQAVVNKFGPKKKIYVNRNVASAQMRCLSERAREGKDVIRPNFVLGYFSGSNTHNGDFELISDVVLQFMLQHDNVVLKIVGCLELPESYKQVEERILRIGFLPWEDLPQEIAAVDVNLMPLQNTFFHHCKSENKWMEAALVEVPTIASYYDELADVTNPGENILLCTCDEDWSRNLECLYADLETRQRIATNAYRYVVQHKTTLNRQQSLLEFVKEN